MTTLIQTRNPLETLSMSQQPTARRRSKRLAAYEEEDGDFIFTRGSKRTKASPPEPERAAAPVPPKKTRKTKEVKEVKGHPEDADPVTTKPKQRRMSFSTPMQEKDTISVPKRRKSTRSSTSRNQNGDSSHQAGVETTDYDSIDLVGAPRADESSNRSTQQSTVISLPFSDTPIINRNKELRKKGNGTRRSSLGMRGRRASSLIDNGHSAIPHREVEASEFYKHIEADGLSEPRRMRQLLTWTGERALGGKPSHGDPDSAAHLAARVIKETLLKDFANRSDFSNWFNREEPEPTRIVKKPNPRNIEIEENLAGLESRIKRLKEERDEWKAIAKPPPPLPPLFADESTDLSPSHIDGSLLDPEQAAILATISESSSLDLRNTLSDRLNSIRGDLEFKADYFADGVHKLEQYQETAGKVADKIEAISSVRLEERNRKEKEAVGTRDLPMQEVLRSLSRILPEGSSGNGR